MIDYVARIYPVSTNKSSTIFRTACAQWKINTTKGPLTGKTEIRRAAFRLGLIVSCRVDMLPGQLTVTTLTEQRC